MFDREWREERTDRHLLAANTAPFGVSYLDDALGGIMPNDLFLVGARTGRGKTEFATTIAYQAAAKCKRVAFFALEADRWEIHRRMKYRKLAQLFHTHYAGPNCRMQFPRYREWLLQGYSPEWEALEREAEKELALQTESLRIVYKGERYTAEDFARDLEAMSLDTDIFIVDHLHYFDLLGTSETEGLKRAAHAVRNASIFHGKPVVLLAHLRKGERATTKTLPDLEDFHGHSDIVKVATTVLLLSPCAKIVPGSFPTYFHIAKARSASDVTPFVGILGFDFKTNAYSERYYLERASFTKDPEPIESADAFPGWAKRAVRPRAYADIRGGRE